MRDTPSTYRSESSDDIRTQLCKSDAVALTLFTEMITERSPLRKYSRQFVIEKAASGTRRRLYVEEEDIAASRRATRVRAGEDKKTAPVSTLSIEGFLSRNGLVDGGRRAATGPNDLHRRDCCLIDRNREVDGDGQCAGEPLTLDEPKDDAEPPQNDPAEPATARRSYFLCHVQSPWSVSRTRDVNHVISYERYTTNMSTS